MLQAVFCLLACLRNLFYLLKVFVLGLFVVLLSSSLCYWSLFCIYFSITSCVCAVLMSLALTFYLMSCLFVFFYVYVSHTLLQIAQCLGTCVHAISLCMMCVFSPSVGPLCLFSQLILQFNHTSLTLLVKLCFCVYLCIRNSERARENSRQHWRN